MHWPADDFWRFWVSQPEIRAADEQRRAEEQQREAAQRQLAWKISKTESRIQRETQKLQRAGLSDRTINRLRRLAGVSRQEIARDASMFH